MDMHGPEWSKPMPALLLIAAVLGLLPAPSRRGGEGEGAASTFQDQTVALGLALGNDAACWADVDNDGWVDLITAGVVWKNEGGKRFTKLADVGGGCIAADFDNDGFVDLFSWETLKLYRNEGGKRFTEFKLPDLPATVSRGACWGDFNGDGFVDLYIGGYEDWDRDITYPSLLLLNQQGKSFKLVWQDATYRTRGVTACDFDRNGTLDVYVSNYRLQPNRLLQNDGSAHFKDVAAECNVIATSPGFPGGHSIGAAWGDFDDDGYIDLFAGNFAHRDDRGDQPKSRFLRSLGPKASFHFEDKGTCGVFYQESYASPAAGDYDNDGNLDLFFTTVYGTASFNVKNYPVLYHNDGRFVFSDATKPAGVSELPPTYQAAWADFNHDGRLDLVSGGKLFVNLEGAAPSAPPRSVATAAQSNRWLELRLSGDGRRVNRSAIGAQVRVKLKGRTITRQVEAGTGEGNQNDLTLHFGLGSFKGHVNLEIFWPDKTIQNLKHVGTNRILDVHYPSP